MAKKQAVKRSKGWFGKLRPSGGDAAVERLEADLQQREKERREAESKAAMERAEAQAAQAAAALAEQEAALKTRKGELARDLTREEEPPPPAGLLERLRRGIAKTRASFSEGLARILLGKKEIDDELLENLEELLLSADVGVETTARLLKGITDRVKRKELTDASRLKDVLREEVHEVMHRVQRPPNIEAHTPAVILFTGVNGTGKTTTIGKLAAHYKAQGKRVLLAAGDTFRAAATEQLAGWAERAGVELFGKEAGADPSGLAYQAVEKAVAEGFDLVLCDTAGRLHTKANLMEELKKIKRVMAKALPGAPHETYLVLDANTGQNAIHQARDFNKAVEVTGLIVTKLDGTARGGVMIGIVNEFDIPVRFVGVGEKVEDLRPFDPRVFAESLFG